MWYIILQFSALLAGEKRRVVVARNTLPARSTVVGNSGWKGCRVMLGLQRKAAVLLHGHAALAGGGAVLQKVSGVQLDARLGGVQLHADAGLSLVTHAQMLWLEPRARSITKQWS